MKASNIATLAMHRHIWKHCWCVMLLWRNWVDLKGIACKFLSFIKSNEICPLKIGFSVLFVHSLIRTRYDNDRLWKFLLHMQFLKKSITDTFFWPNASHIFLFFYKNAFLCIFSFTGLSVCAQSLQLFFHGCFHLRSRNEDCSFGLRPLSKWPVIT